MDRESPDVIEAELAATRMSLVAKLDAAETKTVGAVKEVISTLEGDAKSVQAAVTDTVGAVREEAVAGLRDMLRQIDPTPYVRRNPWAAVGGSVVGGIVVGLFAFRDYRPRHVTAAAKGTAAKSRATKPAAGTTGTGAKAGTTRKAPARTRATSTSIRAPRAS